MRKLISINHVSLDGVMQSPGGSQEDPRNGFKLGGWIVPYWDEQMGERLDQTVSGAFDLLLGRRTYEILAAHWPYAEKNPIANGFNRATKYVETRGKPAFDWVNSQALQGDAVEAVRQLKSGTGPEIQIYGSSSFLQALIAADLIDEYLIRIYPFPWPRQAAVRREHTATALRLWKPPIVAGSSPAAIAGWSGQPGSFGGDVSKAEVARRRHLAAEEA